MSIIFVFVNLNENKLISLFTVDKWEEGKINFSWYCLFAKAPMLSGRL